MITAAVFILFGLIGSLGSVIFLIKNQKGSLSFNWKKQTAVIGSMGSHGLLILIGILLLQEFTPSFIGLFMLCALTVLSRIWNGHVLFQKVNWPHHLISTFILGAGLFFYLH